MRFRRKADDQDRTSLSLYADERFRLMPDMIDADLLHHGGGERVGRLAGAHAGRIDIDARTGEMFEDRCGHRRAHGVVVAGEEDRARQIARCRQDISPSSAARRAA